MFKVGGKLFAISACSGRPLKVSLKCEPALAEQLRATTTRSGRVPPEQAPLEHGGRGRARCPTGMVADMIEDSYDLVVAKLPRRVREELGWAPRLARC